MSALPIDLRDGIPGAAKAFPSGANAVTLKASAQNGSAKGISSPTLTVTVEGSDDGSSWSEVAAFTLTAVNSVQEQTVDSSSTYFRATWTVGSGLWGIPSVSAELAVTADGSGGAQPSIVLRGPYTVNWDDPDVLVAPGVPFLPLEVGQWLIEAWVQITTLFSGPGVGTVALEIGTNGADPGNNTAIADWEVGHSEQEHYFDLEQATSALVGFSDATPLTATRSEAVIIRKIPARVATACDLCAVLFPDAGTLEAGQALVWVVVGTATP